VLHARIEREAQAARSVTRDGFRDSGEFPALGDLLESAREAMEAAIPATFTHAGKTYRLRVSVGLARLMVFANATEPEPLAVGLAGSCEEFGHTPAS
jgi:hypothetical protein